MQMKPMTYPEQFESRPNAKLPPQSAMQHSFTALAAMPSHELMGRLDLMPTERRNHCIEWLQAIDLLLDLVGILERLCRPRACGAKTRGGGACLRRPLAGKKRCRLHGGMATGPRTALGRLKVAQAAQLRMIQRWRQIKAQNERGEE